PVMGEIGVVTIVPRDPQQPPTLDELRAFGRDSLAAYKLPEALAVVESLPLTAMEKVDRAALRRQIEADEHVRERAAVMDLAFTADQEELRDSVRAVLTSECPPALVREIVEARVAGKPAAADALWRTMVELGWPALTVPEAAGGLGLGVLELAVV